MSQYYDDLADLGDEVVGTLELADVGFFRRGKRRGGRSRGMNVRKLVPRVPGAPAVGVGLQPMPLGTVQFTQTSGTLLQVSVTPQRPFKGQRLVIAEGRSGTTGGIVNLLRLEIGTYNQLVSSQAGVPVAAFANNSFDTNMLLQPATPGVNITLLFQITSAPTGTDSVTISAALWGTVIG
jgi:hypothetical protein